MSAKLIFAMWAWSVRSLCSAILASADSPTDRRFLGSRIDQSVPQYEEYDQEKHAPYHELMWKGHEEK